MGREKWTDDQFGKRIKAERERRRWSQNQMATMLTQRKTPMHATTIAKIEAGDRSVRITEAVAFAELFEVTVDALLGRTGPDQSTLTFALVVLADYVRDAERLIKQTQGVVADIGEQVESVDEGFDVPSIDRLHRAASELGTHLESAQRSARDLDRSVHDAIIGDAPRTPQR